MAEAETEQKSVAINAAYPIHAVTLSFIHKLDAVRGSMDLFLMLSDASVVASGDAHRDALEKFGTLVEERGDRRIFNVPIQHIRKTQRERKKHEQAITANALLPRTLLVAFISDFDAFLGSLLQELLRLQPEVLNSSDRKLTFKELMSVDSLDQARNALTSREIEAFMRESYAEQFAWLQKTFSVKTRDGLDCWSLLIEITERRHLFVHTDGVVTSQYLQVCHDHGVSISTTKLGDRLGADKAYLVQAYKCLFEIAVKLGQVMWRKVRPKEIHEADKKLNELAYDLLLEEKYELATAILEFAVRTLPRHGNQEAELMFIVNLAQAYKFAGREEKCQSLINEKDWSACDDRFKICIDVLNDRFDAASNIMRRLGSTGVLTEFFYRDWPIFRKFRETSDFRAAFLEVFGKEPIEEETLNDGAAKNSEPNQAVQKKVH